MDVEELKVVSYHYSETLTIAYDLSILGCFNLSPGAAILPPSLQKKCIGFRVPNVGDFSELRVAVFIGGTFCGKEDPHLGKFKCPILFEGGKISTFLQLPKGIHNSVSRSLFGVSMTLSLESSCVLLLCKKVCN